MAESLNATDEDDLDYGAIAGSFRRFLRREALWGG